MTVSKVVFCVQLSSSEKSFFRRGFVFGTHLSITQKFAMSSTVSQITIHATRPMCAKDRANAYEAMRRKTIATPPTTSPPQSLASSNASDYTPLDTRMTGDLVDFQEELRSFDMRFNEPTVGMFMDTRAATSGDLYDLRDELLTRA